MDSKSQENQKTEIVNVQITTDNSVRICGILDQLDFDDNFQIALLLWPAYSKGKIGLHEAAYLADLYVDELESYYEETGLALYQARRELEQEQKNIDEVLRKREGK